MKIREADEPVASALTMNMQALNPTAISHHSMLYFNTTYHLLKPSSLRPRNVAVRGVLDEQEVRSSGACYEAGSWLYDP